MPHRRHLIPLLVAVLVIQVLVGVLPHHHGSTAVDGQAVQTPSTVDVSHHCLACSVHAPVVEQQGETGISTAVAVAVMSPVDHPARHVLPIVASVGPRGPPGVVGKGTSLTDNPVD